jgi:hypothetical protein
MGAAAAALAGAGLATVLAAGGASAALAAPAAVSPPPVETITPASTVVGQTSVIFYVGGNGSVYMNQVNGANAGLTTPVGGHVTAAPSAIAPGSSAIVFGRGTNDQLYVNTCALSGSCTGWASLGGTITSKPGAVFQGPNVADYSVYARGGDGAVWGRSHTTAGWGAWHPLGGKLLTGTGPSAAYLNGTYVLVVGTNSEVFIAEAGVTGFTATGGLTDYSPALTVIPDTTPVSAAHPPALVGFARGFGNSAYYHRFLSTSPGWHSMGGQFLSGLSADTFYGSTVPTTDTYGIGIDGRIYQSRQSWPSYPPAVSGWALTP